jgi:hypothetical protein
MTNMALVAQPLTMSSREIADLTGKRHDQVLRDIRTMLGKLYPKGVSTDLRKPQEEYHRGDRTQYKYLRGELHMALFHALAAAVRRDQATILHLQSMIAGHANGYVPACIAIIQEAGQSARPGMMGGA